MTLKGSNDQPLKIAFTYDRQADWIARGLSEEQCVEFESNATIEDIASTLRKFGSVEMIGGLRALVTRLTSKTDIDWDLVFNICEGYEVPGREAQVPALLEAWGLTFTFSDSATLALCLDKAKTKMILEHYKIPTAPFACVPPRNSLSDASLGLEPMLSIANSPHRDALQSFPLFVKPSAVSSGIGITQTNKVMNLESLRTVVEDLSRRYPSQHILIERFLEGREFTVGIVGTGPDARVLGVRELVFLKHNPDHPIDPEHPYETHDPALLDLDVYGRDLKRSWSPNPQYKDISVSDPVGQAVASVALRAWHVLGCRDGGRVDVRHDIVGPAAIPNFIEVNPIAGLRPNWSDLPRLAKAQGIEFEQLLGLFIESAMKRVLSGN